MKITIPLITLCFIIAVPAAAENLDKRANESRATVKEFMGLLKVDLKTALKQGGPIAAIDACKSSAPEIAAAQSKKHGWQIGRTSLKLRNPDNAPDDWETTVLKEFAARKAAGEEPGKIERYEVVMQDGKQFFRYMKAIPTAEKPCLACHGSKISPKVTEALDRQYPQDQARGYQAGDIRGAFSITQPM